MKLQSVNRKVAFLSMVFFVALSVSSSGQKKNADDSQHGATLQPLNIKPGLWEQTVNSTVAGEMPIPAEMLNRLTPEQRARMEDRMKANSAAHTHTTTDKHCLSKEDAQKNKFLNLDRNKECTGTITTSTSTSAKGRVSCESEGMKMTGALEILARDSEHVNGSWHATTNGAGHTMNVDSTFTSKWLGPSCGNVK
ncbi:MAG TPA: DUF3617 domain-containing protein [Terriglobales bacterium]|jgi:hypothetical protein